MPHPRTCAPPAAREGRCHRLRLALPRGRSIPPCDTLVTMKTPGESDAYHGAYFEESALPTDKASHRGARFCDRLALRSAPFQAWPNIATIAVRPSQTPAVSHAWTLRRNSSSRNRARARPAISAAVP